MIMYPTAEVRWFYPGAVPSNVERSFRRRGGAVQDEPLREDCYLSLPDMDGLGIKLREGRIEIKKRLKRQGPIPLGEEAVGVLEHWRKWSFPLAESHVMSSMVTPAASWAGVKKQRLLRTYRVTPEQRVVSCSEGESPSQGCELELTEVSVRDQVWWTLAFEAFGEESCLQEHLLLVVGHVLNTYHLPHLHAEASYGYARWLAKLERLHD
jgi:hypothetical protein